jgi:hypothetical protein
VTLTTNNWRLREAAKQAHSRDLNEAVAKLNEKRRAKNCTEVFSCECGDPGCKGQMSLSVAEYESVRAYPARFVVVANHENPEVERVVTEGNRFAVIETLAGEASKTALRSNPRRAWPLAGGRNRGS